MSIVAWLIVGAVSGWLAGHLYKGEGFGCLGNILIGVVGAFIGGGLAQFMGIEIGGGFISSVVTAVLGAIILLFIVGLVKD
jgi:uncharacterized membrane protein YeaQ/YmgE (transglycosylase-associated protein family)